MMKELPPKLRFLDGVGGLIAQYDAFAVDIWGVVHNNVEPYAGVITCLRHMRDAGRRVVLISNAPRLSDQIREMLDRIGVPGDAYDFLFTSGDVTRAALARREDAWHAALGRRCFHIGVEAHRSLLEGLPYEIVEDIDHADFILLSGLFNEKKDTIATYTELFGRALRRKLPMVCANPDLAVMRGHRTVLCAGSLAKSYAADGGDVRFYGKPYGPIYRACMEWLAVPANRVLAIGDTPWTDLAGAAAAGMDALLVTGGMHAEDFGVAPDGSADQEKIAAACRAVGAWPTAVIRSLRL